MFGGANKIKLDADLMDRVKKVAEVAGYASHEEFVVYIIERELAQFEDAGDDDAAIVEKLKGLGYIS
jgi:predicted transcriptional regulator